ncbi:uncharacterized protein LOC135479863 [Liolophura sinensis]|uniref:uncharacterized protein LOC135479863 n=1 Tax=Liolophura sinensis TaxID=3198878 RepID=UPI0031596564
MVGLRFDRRRALATGIALSGAGVGVLVLSYPIERLLTEYGWRGTALIISGIFLNCCVFAAMIFPKKTSGKQEDPSVIAKDNFDRKDEHLVFPYRTRHGDNKRDQCAGNPLLHGSFPIIYIHTTPTRAEDDTKGIEFRQQTKSAVIVSSQNPKIWCSEPLLSFNPTEKLRSVDTQLDEQRDAKRIPQGTEGKLTLWLRRHLYLSTNVSFHMLLFVMCLYTGMFQVIMYLPDLAVSRGLSRPEAALLLSAFGVTNVIGRILVGALSNLRRVDSTVLYAAGLLLLALNTTVLPHCSSLPHFVTASIVFGLCCASCISLRTVVIADVMSSDLLVDAFGVICVAQGVCYMVLPSLCGRLYQSSGGFVGPLYLIAAMCDATLAKTIEDRKRVVKKRSKTLNVMDIGQETEVETNGMNCVASEKESVSMELRVQKVPSQTVSSGLSSSRDFMFDHGRFHFYIDLENYDPLKTIVYCVGEAPLDLGYFCHVPTRPILSDPNEVTLS